MVRVELFVLLGLVVGFPLGILATRLVSRYLTWRDARLVRVRVHEKLHEVETPELLNELSKRDDLASPRKRSAS